MKSLLKGVILIAAVIFISACSMKSMMLEERVSPYDLDKTIEVIQGNAEDIGWVVSGVKDMNKAITKHGGPDLGGQVRIIELCNAQYAGKILSDENARYSALLMPCSIAVYTKDDGKTYVSSMKAGRMGGMMGGVVAEVMADVDVDQKKMLEFLD